MIVRKHARTSNFNLLLQSDDILKLALYHFLQLKDCLVFVLGAYDDVQLGHSRLILIELALQKSVVIH